MDVHNRQEWWVLLVLPTTIGAGQGTTDCSVLESLAVQFGIKEQNGVSPPSDAWVLVKKGTPIISGIPQVRTAIATHTHRVKTCAW